jgi:hypothetical protein
MPIMALALFTSRNTVSESSIVSATSESSMESERYNALILGSNVNVACDMV